MINPEFKESVKGFFEGWWTTMSTSALEDEMVVFYQLMFTIAPLTVGILGLTLPSILGDTISTADRWLLGIGIFLTTFGGINLIMHIVGVILWIFGIRR